MSARAESEESQEARYKKRLAALNDELVLVKNALTKARADKNRIGIVVLRDLKTRVERKVENEKRFQAILTGKTYTGKTMGADEEFVPTAIRRKYDWRFTNSKKDVEERFKRYLGKEKGESFARKYSIDSIVYKNMYFLEQEREKEKRRREREKKRAEKEELAKEKAKAKKAAANKKPVAKKKPVKKTPAKKKVTKKKVVKKKPVKKKVTKKVAKKRTTKKKPIKKKTTKKKAASKKKKR